MRQKLERYGSVLDALLVEDDPAAADAAQLSALATGIRILADRLVGTVESAQRKRLAWGRVDAL